MTRTEQWIAFVLSAMAVILTVIGAAFYLGSMMATEADVAGLREEMREMIERSEAQMRSCADTWSITSTATPTSRSGTSGSVFGPPSASPVRREIAADAVSPLATARPATRARADPVATAMSTGARAMAAPGASFGAAAGAPARSPRVRRQRRRAAALSSWRGLRGHAVMWSGGCRRGTGLAEPIPGYARRRTATPGSGGTAIRGAAACRHFTPCESGIHGVERRGGASKGTETGTAGHTGRGWSTKRATAVSQIG